MRTQISLADGVVTLTYDCIYLGVPMTHSYRRHGRSIVDQDGRQVCNKLCNTGYTLRADNDEEMLETIRRHWKMYRADAKRDIETYR